MDENWQKVQIPLDSVIDSNMADMLRPLSNPALVFNRQVLQGGYLPTSVRFEKNGWFCGIYGYDYDTSSSDALKDRSGIMPDMQVERRQTYVSTAYHIMSDDDAGDAVNFVYYPLTRVLTYASSSEPNVEWVPDDSGNLTIVKVAGKTHDFDNDYVFYIDMSSALDGDSDPSAAKTADWILVDPEGVDFDFDGNVDISNTILFDHKRYVYSYAVYDKDQSFTDELTLNYTFPFYIGNEVHELDFDGRTFNYGDNNLISAHFSQWPLSCEVECCNDCYSVEANEVSNLCTGLVFDCETHNVCAIDLQGDICIDVNDNVSALTDTYYIDLDLKQCACTNQSAIGKNATATVLKCGESMQVPLAAAGFVCLGTSCPFTACNSMLTGNNTYAECVSGAVPIWSAQTVWLLRFFGDDIFYRGQNAGESGIVATYVPQQYYVAAAGGCGAGDHSCSQACCVDSIDSCGDPTYKQYYCTIYGNKQYGWTDKLSRTHLFSSHGMFYTGAVDQCSSSAKYKSCVSICVPLWYPETGQTINTEVCVLLDSMAGNMQVQSVGCIMSITADPEGFSAGGFSNCHPFAPLPGSVPQFIVHSPFVVNICNGPWSNSFLNNVLNCMSAVCTNNSNPSLSVMAFLKKNYPALFNYWNGNDFYANMQVTPVTVVYPTAGWFQSYVSFKGLQGGSSGDVRVNRSLLDCPDISMFCVETPWCSLDNPAMTCCRVLCQSFCVCYNSSAQSLNLSNLPEGASIVITTTNGCKGEDGCASWWCSDCATQEVCYCIGKAGDGGCSGVGVNLCYSVNGSVCNMTIPGGAGGGGGAPGFIEAVPLSSDSALPQRSPTWTQYGSGVDLCTTSCYMVCGGQGGQGGLATIATINVSCAISSLSICMSPVQCTGCQGSDAETGSSCWETCECYDEHGCLLCTTYCSPAIVAQCSHDAGAGAANMSAACASPERSGCAGTDGNCVTYFDASGFSTTMSKSDAISCVAACTHCDLHWQSGAAGCGYLQPYTDACLSCYNNEQPYACVQVYAFCCCTDWQYDVVNLQNEKNCFGIHLKCNCVQLSNFLMCCTQGNNEIRAIELVPYLSDGFIYITSAIDAKPAWSTTLALTTCNYWDRNNPDTYVQQFCGEFIATSGLFDHMGFDNGVCLILQSSRGCDGRVGTGGDSGYTVVATVCFCDSTTEVVCAVGGAGGGGGGAGGAGAWWRCGAYTYSCNRGRDGANGSGSPGSNVVYTTTSPVSGVHIDVYNNSAVSINGADAPAGSHSYSRAGNGGNGCAGQEAGYLPSYICEYAHAQPGSCGGSGGRIGTNNGGGSISPVPNNSSACFIRIYGTQQIAGTEPWSMSNDTAIATKLGNACGMSPQIVVPVNLSFVNRLVDVTVSTAHDSYHNLPALAGTCAIDTSITFVDNKGVCQCVPTCWTRDNGICVLCCVECNCCYGCYINPFVAILHGNAAGCCPFDYGLVYCVACKCVTDKAYDTCGKPINTLYNFNYNAGSASLGGFSGCYKGYWYTCCECGQEVCCWCCDESCVPEPQVGYTTNETLTHFGVSFDSCSTVTEPYLVAKWHGDYKLCSRLALPHVKNALDCGIVRNGIVSSYSKGMYNISYNNVDNITYNECHESVSSAVYVASVKEACATDANVLGCASICICGADFDCGTFTLQGIYKNLGTEDLNLKRIDNDYLTMQYADSCCCSCICIQDILDNKTFLDITATNVNCSVHDKDGNDNTNETKIASIELNSEYQIVKQKWDTTVETENIWWIDSSHILELTTDKFILSEKSDELDDWNGNKWTVVAEWMRSDFLDSTVVRHGVSSVYGDNAESNHGALLWTMNVLDSSHFRLNVYIPSEGMRRAFARVFTIKELNYGQALPLATDVLGMYTSMDARALLTQAEVSATNVGWHFIIGLHVDNCLKQWSFAFSTREDKSWALQTKITGYGYVAADGSLTGGQFPEQHVSQANGFFGAVNFINELANYRNRSIDGAFDMTGIYGTQEQQWYLYKEVRKVCSHFTFSEHADIKNQGNTVPFAAKWLPISSNYSAIYSSPSFMLNKMTGFLPVATTLGSIFDFGVPAVDTLVNVLTAIASPSVWFLNICWIKLGFLQQTIGQYAYTYKTTDRDIDIDTNSIDINTSNNENMQNGDVLKAMLDAYKNNASTLVRDSLSFDKQERAQTCTTKSNSNEGVSNFWIALLQAGIGGLNGAVNDMSKASANSVVNESTISDKAKIFSQFAIENALNVAASSLGANATDNIMLASKVTAVKTLDMFYSTSSNSNMYAGPGYVCHNFIGYCVAQSMSNRLMSGTQSSMFTALSVLSMLSYMVRTVMLKAVSKMISSISNSLHGSATYALATGTVWGNIAEAAIKGGNFVTDRLIDMNEFFFNIMPELLRSVCPGYPNPKFNLVPGLSQHDIDIEAKHHYGSKHCLFMWPCFGCESTYFTREKVAATIKDVPVKVDFTPQNNSIVGSGKGTRQMYTQPIDNVTDRSNDNFKKSLYDFVHSHYAYAKGSSSIDNVPPDTAVVEGTSSFLPAVPFKNENIDIDAAFAIPPIQDYMLNSEWQIGKTAGPSGVLWTTVKDTKVIDGDTSNIIITDESAYIASPYIAVEVKKQIEREYIRPVAVTPNALAWNMTGLNVSYDSEMKHGFDGIGYRLVHWAGSSGMGTEYLTLEYCFFDNDHFKRSNKLQPNRFWGSFTSLPTVANNANFNDGLYHQFEVDAKGIGTEQLTASENKNTMRNAIPLFTEQLSTMPAVVKALSSYRLDVVSGVTSLATQGRTTQSKYKIPKSVDFNINKHLYRATEEYVNELNEQGLAVGEVVAKMGLEFIGATPTQAFFYSEATRAYYSFVGANTITKQDVWNRFKDIRDGKWDFVNQNVVFQCIGNMSRLMDNVDDNDDSLIDNIFIATMSGEKPGVTGEITPPNTAVFDNESWFKTYSFSGGVAFQGPNRYIVNRFIVLDYMIDDIVANKGKWKKVPRNEFNPYRQYNEEFRSVDDRIGDDNDYTYTKATEWDSTATYYYQPEPGKWKRAYALTEEKFLEGDYYTRKLTPVVEGWTHNPFLLATAPLGIDEDTDCMFEWQLTFTWTDEMDKLYKQDDYVCVNIMAQTMCPGGKKRCEPTHLFLHKSLFTRSENSGYYSFKFSSRNGAGNREQLFVWSDGYIAMTGLSLSYKIVTNRRTAPLAVEQNDIQEMSEF